MNPPDDVPAAAEEYLKEISALLKLPDGQVVATRGGTAADGWALRASVPAESHIVISGLEHAAVSATADLLAASQRCTVTRVGAGRDGKVDPKKVLDAVTEHTSLVSVIAASNETGVIQPLERIAAGLADRGVLFHSDVVQAIGRVPVPFELLDLASFSAHKFGALSGLGFCWVRSGLDEIWARMEAAHPRASAADYDLPGLAAVCEALRFSDGEQLKTLRDRFEDSVSSIEGVHVIGADYDRLPNTSLLRFDGCEGDGLMMALDMEDIAVS
ncbi:MAG: aminotransferase class V-fold PLP-dependent enzyme, partial [Myxococcota bacterium]